MMTHDGTISTAASHGQQHEPQPAFGLLEGGGGVAEGERAMGDEGEVFLQQLFLLCPLESEPGV